MLACVMQSLGQNCLAKENVAMNATRELVKTGSGKMKKFSTLLALRKAILDERYEDCGKLVASALRFHASQAEVAQILQDPYSNLEGF